MGDPIFSLGPQAVLLQISLHSNLEGGLLGIHIPRLPNLYADIGNYETQQHHYRILHLLIQLFLCSKDRTQRDLCSLTQTSNKGEKQCLVSTTDFRLLCFMDFF